MKYTALFLVAASALAAVDGATRVAVIELGKRGAVQRTNSRDSWTTVAGVASFWSALHSPGRKLQHAGMPVVPDLFKKAGDGMVVGLKGSGVDLDKMPFVASLLTEEGSNGVVGHLEVDGTNGDKLLSKVRDVDSVDAFSFTSSCKRHAWSSGLTGMMTNVEDASSGIIDGHLRDVIKSLDEEATKADRTVVLHLVVEEEENSAQRRRLSRRLEGEDEEEGEGEQNGEQNEEGNENAEGNNGNNNGGNGQNKGYYGYGYYNSFGEWVSSFWCKSLL